MMRILLPLAILIIGCGSNPTERDESDSAPADISMDDRGLVVDSGMVVCAHSLASEVGKRILQQGGNAVDAAVAVQFALAVVYPRAGNIGGGGFMVLRLADGSTDALDFREMAPANSDRDMYLNKQGKVIPGLSTDGHLAVGVPGSVAGMVEAHKKYGKLSWVTLIQPAIDLAQKGFPLTEKEAEGMNRYRRTEMRFCSVVPEYLDREWETGDTIVWSDLASTLERIRDSSAAGFYSGKTAQLIVDEMKRGDGLITKEDLKNYKAVWRKPIEGDYKEYRVISMPPPSSGGVALLQLLEMVKPFDLKGWGPLDPRTIHIMVEAERRVYADRSEFLGDPDFVSVPTTELLDVDYLKQRMADVDTGRATASDDVSPGSILPPESTETTHFSIVDPMGNAVSITTTLNGNFGSGVLVDGAGFILNNEMDDFSSKPGEPNMYGLLGNEANAIVPGKRMLSSMTPTIVAKEGKLHMVVGTPGGATIITGVFQTILKVIEHDMTMQQAVSTGRFHHQWLPDYIKYEGEKIPVDVIERLDAMGHVVQDVGSLNRMDAILVLPNGRLEGGADPRGDDTAAGF